MTKLISGKSPKIERKSFRQSVNHDDVILKTNMEIFDFNVRKNFSIPEEAIRTLIDNSYFGAALFEWVWYETTVE